MRAPVGDDRGGVGAERRPPRVLATIFLALLVASPAARATDMARAIAQVKPSVVAIGTYIRLRSPSAVFSGTGFVVGDGRHVVTNHHVVAKALDETSMEKRIVLYSKGGEPVPREAELVVSDEHHDIALLRISGDPLPALRIGDSSSVQEGRMLAFTGFPLGIVLGFHPVTHRGMVSAITPVVLPGITAKNLTAKSVSRIRNTSYRVFQIDGTAYPGNSGSPLYDPADGSVYAIINATFVQGTREAAVSTPSGITYAIPGEHIRAMLKSAGVSGID